MIPKRTSRPEVFCKKGVLENSRVLGQACKFIKKETLAQVFSYEFCEIFQNTFFYRTPPVAASGQNEKLGRLLHTYFYKNTMIFPEPRYS